MHGDLHRSTHDTTSATPAATVTAARRARVGLREAAANVADFHLAALPTDPPGGQGTDQAVEPGGFVHQALLGQAVWGHVLAFSVACEVLVNGSTWDVVAAALGEPEDRVRARYEPFVDELAAGAEHPSWLPCIAGVTVNSPGEVRVPADTMALDELERQQAERARGASTRENADATTCRC